MSDRLRRRAGVDSEFYQLAFPGDRVLTPDGIGTVISVEDGFAPQTETYEIELDNGLGGGEYRVNDISLLDELGRTARRTPFACRDCGRPAHSAISGGYKGSTPLCDDCRSERGKNPRKMAGLKVPNNATVEQIADALIAESTKVEPKITQDLKSVAERLGGKMEGLEFRLKKRDSLVRKLKQTAEEERVSGQALSDEIRDAVRYTMVYPVDLYAVAVQMTLDELKGKGYLPLNVKNYWSDRKDNYDGINTNLSIPGSSMVMELQFHTSQSLRLKEEVVHSLYEKYRVLPDGNPIKNLLWNTMVQYWQAIPSPGDVSAIGRPANYPQPVPPSSVWERSMTGWNTLPMPDWVKAARLVSAAIANGMRRHAARQYGLELAPQGSTKTAADDYPELSNILWERPDLLAAEPVGGMMTSVGQRHGSVTRVAITPKDLRDKEKANWTSRVPESQRTRQYKDGNPFPSYQTAQDAIDDPATPWWWRHMVGPAVERMEKSENAWGDVGNLRSVDWCRFRKNSRCFYPKDLDEEATAQAGYPVWIPTDRGECWRSAWKDQKVCSKAEPGPNSRERVSYPDATVPWSEGGQRTSSLTAEAGKNDLGDCYMAAARVVMDTFSQKGDDKYFLCHGLVVGTGGAVAGRTYGHAWAEVEQADGSGTLVIDKSNGNNVTVPKDVYYSIGNINPANVIRYSKQEMMRNLDRSKHYGPWDKRVESSLQVVAKWRDVQQKARRIASEGGVHIIAVADWTITADVKGDSAIYQTGVTRVPNTKQIALWTCGCPWSMYSWGRSGRWKKFEGRMCAHALALVYQAQREEMFGGKIIEGDELPDWWKEDSERVIEQRSAPPGTWRMDVAAAMKSHLAALEGVRSRTLRRTDLPSGVRAVMAKNLSVSASLLRTDLEAFTVNPSLLPIQMVAISDINSVKPFFVNVGGYDSRVMSIDPVKLTCEVENVGEVPLSFCQHPTYDPVEGLIPPAAPVVSAVRQVRETQPPALVYQKHDTDFAAEDRAWLESNGGLAALHDEPEPALPRTDGEMTGDPANDDNELVDKQDGINSDDVFMTASAPDATSRNWIMQGSKKEGDFDVAAAAKEFLSKTALKDFSAAEQAEIIDEGESVKAANLDLLQIEGTHYQALEASASDFDSDEDLFF